MLLKGTKINRQTLPVLHLEIKVVLPATLVALLQLKLDNMVVVAPFQVHPKEECRETTHTVKEVVAMEVAHQTWEGMASKIWEVIWVANQAWVNNTNPNMVNLINIMAKTMQVGTCI